MMKNAIKNDDRGLTLIELIVGVVILAIIVTPLLHAFVTGANTAKKTKQYSDATLAAQNIIEDFEATPMKQKIEGLSLNENGEYVLQMNNISSGGTDFDAKVTITPTGSGDIPVSNQMDAIFAMQEIDATARALYLSSADAGFGVLKRYITITVTSVDSTTCNVQVLFRYIGTAQKTDIDGDGNKSYETVQFKYPQKNDDGTYTPQVSMNVSLRSTEGTAFAIYLFFTAYKTDDDNFSMGKTIIYNETTGDNARDFNVFLIDVGDDSDSIKTSVEYKPTEKGTTVDLMTNMGDVTYKVYKSGGSIWQTPSEVPVNLVETSTINRLYDIEVEIYKSGDTSEALATMSTTKLDYSDQ